MGYLETLPPDVVCSIELMLCKKKIHESRKKINDFLNNLGIRDDRTNFEKANRTYRILHQVHKKNIKNFIDYIDKRSTADPDKIRLEKYLAKYPTRGYALAECYYKTKYEKAKSRRQQHRSTAPRSSVRASAVIAAIRKTSSPKPPAPRLGRR